MVLPPRTGGLSQARVSWCRRPDVNPNALVRVSKWGRWGLTPTSRDNFRRLASEVPITRWAQWTARKESHLTLN